MPITSLATEPPVTSLATEPPTVPITEGSPTPPLPSETTIEDIGLASSTIEPESHSADVPTEESPVPTEPTSTEPLSTESPRSHHAEHITFAQDPTNTQHPMGSTEIPTAETTETSAHKTTGFPIEETTSLLDILTTSASSETTPEAFETTQEPEMTTIIDSSSSSSSSEETTRRPQQLPTMGPGEETTTGMEQETTSLEPELTTEDLFETTAAESESSTQGMTETTPPAAPSEPSTDILATESSGPETSTEGIETSTEMESTTMEVTETPTEEVQSSTMFEPTEGVTDLSTEMMESTSAPEPETCDDCPELNVHLFNGNPYEDGASVLNRFTNSGCKFVQFFCRPFVYGDDRPVRTVFNEDATIADLPLNVEAACRNGQWYDQQRNISTSSLSCIYELEDPNNPCMQCERNFLVAPGEDHQEGVSYVDYRVEHCLSIHLYCQTTKSTQNVDLLQDGVDVGLQGSSLNRTFSCNDNAQWVDDTTSNTLTNVSCVMKKGTPLPPWTSTTGGAGWPFSSTTYEETTTVEWNTSTGEETDSTSDETPGENATLCVNDNTALISGSGSHLMKFTCNADGRWATDDGTLTESVSCLVQKIQNGVTSQPELSTPPTTTTTTTARPPGLGLKLSFSHHNHYDDYDDDNDFYVHIHLYNINNHNNYDTM
ncbi:unnamed protein product [Nippostrongylus brasiliensis]|uniref:C6 domain-containing protein n=1 Tax=Nippostrongylus brasiliensis TaxID=27835 RepID=A0A0N4YEN7_NIPBR|nr:unnamed protein product [Nippostrongylus brasiliensis]